MKALYSVFATALLTILLIGCMESQEKKSETEMANEDLKTVEETVLENEYAKVLEVSLNSGQQVPWHKGGPRLIYAKSDYSVRFLKNPEDTTTKVKAISKGEVHWHDQNIHSVENAGSSEAEYLVFIRKPASFPKQTDRTTQQDVEETNSRLANVRLENDAVKVIEVMLEPGEEAPMHVGTRRVVYSLSDYEVTFNTPEQPKKSQQFEEGNLHWHVGGEHSVTNSGDTPAEMLLVEFKK